MSEKGEFKVVGSLEDLAIARALIRKEFSQDLSPGKDDYPYLSDDLRQPFGMEPLSYFLVAYAAHVAADATVDILRLLIARLKRTNKNVKVE
jgi:hypothetical protein